MTPNTIFFDKDGTLMDFDSFWVSVSRYALKDVLTKQCSYGAGDIDCDINCLLSSLGVENNETDVDGVLCKGTYAEIAEIVHIFLIKKGCEVDLDSVKEDIRESLTEIWIKAK